jgi:hypothetical protein
MAGTAMGQVLEASFPAGKAAASRPDSKALRAFSFSVASPRLMGIYNEKEDSSKRGTSVR